MIRRKNIRTLLLVLIAILLTTKLAVALIWNYEAFIPYSDTNGRIFLYFLRGYFWEIPCLIVALTGLTKFTPANYMRFMIYPCYFWTTVFVEHFNGNDWMKIGLWGIILPFIFNLNLIRKQYITDNQILARKLAWAMGIGVLIALLPLLRYWIIY